MNGFPHSPSTSTLQPGLTARAPWSHHAGAALSALLAVLGLATVWSTSLMLWGIWTTDPLKSIGMVVPALSFLLILRTWRSLHWELNGTWWGFVLLAATALLVRVGERAVMLLVLAPEWTLVFPPLSVVALAYGSGMVLLFGGVRLLRASLFPLFLLLFVNPVPHVFNVLVDLPLQRASAHVARGFALALGQPLSPDKLRLMFTPNFGMFIAPGCNGIRGAVTMGLIALVAGYLYRFRWHAHAAIVVAAILLGYLFNLVRLCVLVLYYILALHVPWLQDRAENADYLIGAALFFVAVYLLYAAIQHLSGSAAQVLKLPMADIADSPSGLTPGFYLRAAALAVLILLGIGDVVRFFAASGTSPAVLADEAAMGDFPQHVGKYTLVRMWNENPALSKTLLFHWAEYAPPAGGTHISIGVSPVLGSHDTMVCHTARGEDPIWHGPATFPTAAKPVNFSASLYNDGATQSLEVTTLCTGTECGEYTSPRMHLGFVYSRIDPRQLLNHDVERPIPILLKAETIDATLPMQAARQELSEDLSSFLSAVNLDLLTRPYRQS